MSGLTTANIASVATLLGVQAKKPVVDLGYITGGTITVTPGIGDMFRCTITANVTAVNFSGTVPTEYTFNLLVTQGSGGAYTYSDGLLPETNGVAVDVGTTEDHKFMLTYMTLDGGSNWLRFQPGGAHLS